MLNCYWEARLPAGYQKPGSNASSYEVEQFIKDKYVNKRWVDTSLKADPAALYWDDRKKFISFSEKVKGYGNDEEE